MGFAQALLQAAAAEGGGGLNKFDKKKSVLVNAGALEVVCSSHER